MHPARVALAFLTRVPAAEAPASPTDPWPGLARATGYYPLAGVLVGGISLLGCTVGSLLVSPAVGAPLGLAAAYWATRGFHLDGLSDCFDGLLCNGSAERRLAVMRDPHVGGLGAASITLWILVRVAVLAATADTGSTIAALWFATILARAPLAFELHLGPAASPGRGLYGQLHPLIGRADVLRSWLLAAALAAPAAILAPLPALVGLLAAALTTALWHHTWRRSVGGLTGDILGAGVELRELVLMAAFAMPLLSPRG